MAHGTGDLHGQGAATVGEPLVGGTTRRSFLLTGVILGIGLAAFVDEAVFHQILQFHNFYWGSSLYVRMLSDGLFHVFGNAMLVTGGVRLWKYRVAWTAHARRAMIAALAIGFGIFEVYDGVVQHLFLHLHLVDERVCPVVHINNSIATCPQDIPLEVAWIGIGAALLLTGVVAWRRLGRVSEDT